MPPEKELPAGERPKVVIVIQQKGGAGKSTITVNLAALMGRSSPQSSEGESPVVAAGIDPQGSLEEWADRVPEEALPFDYLVTRGEVGVLSELRTTPGLRRIIVDTPGFMEIDPDAAWGGDPLGEGRVAAALREVLDIADLAIVPVTTEFMSWSPAEFTIERILKPKKIPFLVAINLHDPRDGDSALERVAAWADDRAYPRLRQPIRKYKIHAAAAENGLTVVQYRESGSALRAREDFMSLALAVEQAL